MKKAPSTAPVRKGASVNAGNRIPLKHDKRPLEQEEVNANKIELFQPDPTRSILRDYRDNPFQGEAPKKVIGAGLYLSPAVMKDDGDVDAVKTMQTLEHAAVSFGKGNRRSTTDRMHISQVMDVDAAQMLSAPTGQQAVHYPIKPGKVLHNPSLVLGGDERFWFTLHLRDGFYLPSASDWDSSSQGQLHIAAVVQFERLS